MKKKFLIQKTSFLFTVYLLLFYIVFMVLIFSIYNSNTIENNIAVYFFIAFLVLVFPCLLFSKGGTIIFEENYFIIKRTALSKKHFFRYDSIKKMHFQEGNTAMGPLKGRDDPTIILSSKNNKNVKVYLEIQYEIVQRFIEKKPPHCQVKIDFFSLRMYEKYGELLKDYLTGRQKEDIQRMIAQKESRRKKRTNK
ncbi:MAG: hypothetical protein IJB34_07045 [Clostridia bacterium]|nr:hypothetical protein [Clostridia bacterium]MBQ3506746.1 hypothetical protein [Clostridia bacterium]